MKTIINLFTLIQIAYENAVTRFAGFVNSKVGPKAAVADIERAVNVAVPFTIFLLMRFAPVMTINVIIIVGTMLLVYATGYSLATNLMTLLLPPLFNARAAD